MKVLTGWRWLLVLALLVVAPARADSAWDSYKARFLAPEGRIMDTGNGNISHSEGQGYAMLMAVAYNDRAAFNQLWAWTSKNLKNPDNGLFYWRYTPGAADPIADKNDATDGDTLIAWALLRAGKQWRQPDLVAESDAITRALVKNTVVSYGGYRVMLPGVKGFDRGGRINLNPSYFIFPAWRDFYQSTHLVVWQELLTTSQKLLGQMAWGPAKLPTDWVLLSAAGKMTPAERWPARTSYDAVRIPLYLSWMDRNSPLLAPWRAWWQGFPRDKTPAWTNVANSGPTPYFMTGGLLAVRDLTMGVYSGEPTLTDQDDYYSASLKMLVWLVEQGNLR